MKVAVIIARFSTSGVPLAQIKFARALVRRGHEVDLVVGYDDPTMPMPSINGVRMINFSRRKGRELIKPLVRYLRREQPDVVFSSQDHLNAVVLLAALISGSKSRISGSSRITPYDAYSRVPFSKKWFLKYIMRLVSRRADVLTCVSTGMVQQYREIFPFTNRQCVYNIVDDSTSRQAMAETASHPWFGRHDIPVLTAAGSLVPWKGYGDLLRAMKIVVSRRDVRLLILGDGPLRANLQALIDELGLADNVELVGQVDNPMSYFKQSPVFVHPAHLEGLGNVIVEAMMCGCTPVVTNCPTGPREIIVEGRYGYLVPVSDSAVMADAIEQALDHPVPPAELASAIARFSEDAVLDRHFSLLD